MLNKWTSYSFIDAAIRYERKGLYYSWYNKHDELCFLMDSFSTLTKFHGVIQNGSGRCVYSRFVTQLRNTKFKKFSIL